MGLFKASCPMYSFYENNGGKLPEQEALVSPISSTKLSDIDYVVSPKFWLLTV